MLLLVCAIGPTLCSHLSQGKAELTFSGNSEDFCSLISSVVPDQTYCVSSRNRSSTRTCVE
jgi:hypothetical protein